MAQVPITEVVGIIWEYLILMGIKNLQTHTNQELKVTINIELKQFLILNNYEKYILSHNIIIY